MLDLEAKHADLDILYKETLAQREITENKLAMLSAEIERLQNLNKNKTNEIDRLK
jgi:uncharacterized small protein (DUF1192 family)